MKLPSPIHSGLIVLATIACLSPVACLAAEAPAWLGPVAVASSPDGSRVYVALADARQIASVDAGAGTVATKVDVPGEPTALAIDASSGRLYVTCAGPSSSVCVIHAKTLQVAQTFPAGHAATGLALTPDGSRLFVCNRFDNSVAVLSLPDGKPIATVPAVREPVGVAITPDGKTAFVINLLPAANCKPDCMAAVVTAIDVATLAVAEVQLPHGSTSLRGICVSPDGKHAYVTHGLSRNLLPTTQLERGWMNTNALSILDAQTKQLVGTVLLDDVDLGAANPWGVACSPDSKTLCIAHSGTHELSILDLPQLLIKLASRQERLRTTTEVHAPAPPKPTYGQAASWERSVVSLPLDPANDLSFLSDLRRRVALPGNGPRGLVIAGGRVYVAMYFSDNLAVVNLANQDPAQPVGMIRLGAAPSMTEARRGEMLFHDATLCFQRWQSCATCHPDVRVDGLNWDLMNDGYGNPKNTKSLLLSHATPPAMSESVRETAEMAVRAGFRGILFQQCPEPDAKAVDTYLKSLQPVASPHLVGGNLSPAAQRGKELFFSKQANCAECHPAPLFTDLKRHDVGTRGAYDHGSVFDTPSLVECWRTAPYLHDGSFATLAELLGSGKHGESARSGDPLTPEQIADLVEYVLSL